MWKMDGMAYMKKEGGNMIIATSENLKRWSILLFTVPCITLEMHWLSVNDRKSTLFYTSIISKFADDFFIDSDDIVFIKGRPKIPK